MVLCEETHLAMLRKAKLCILIGMGSYLLNYFSLGAQPGTWESRSNISICFS